MTKNFTIVPITEGNMLDDIVELHLDAFAGYLNTLLGRGYIKAFVTWFIRNKGTIAIAAIDDSRKVVGYALCAPGGYSVKLNRDLFWGTAVRMLIRAWLIFNARFRFVLVERIKILVGLRKNAQQTLKLPEPSMSLVAIGVASSQRRSKIGQRLMQAVEGRARALQMRSLVLSVYENASAARHFYEQCGWRLYPTETKNGDVLRYWRLLDDSQGVFSR
jgi:ribosomal protein S18 acetylase RimI-like enzyme